VINHDTSISEVSRNAGLRNDTNHFYVQTIDQKMEVILAGIGIGHLPRHRIQERLEKGELIELPVNNYSDNENFIAWKISNKGKGLQKLSQCLIDEFT
jgi:DNA-binding transcriptional LysR family regulator